MKTMLSFIVLTEVMFLFLGLYLTSSDSYITRGYLQTSRHRCNTYMSTSDEEEITRFRSEVLGQTSSIPSSGAPKINVGRGLLQGGLAFISLAILENGGVPNPFAESNGYPIKGENSIMSGKAHGTTEISVQSNLRFGCDYELANRICSYNRDGAERAGYFQYSTKFLSEVNPNEITTYYDSVTGLPLFRAPIGRTYEEFLEESKSHGWPSFRDEEVVWDNVRAIRGGEMVSLTGTHLGHNLPDWAGNRYCINLVSIAGHNAQSKPVTNAVQVPL